MTAPKPPCPTCGTPDFTQGMFPSNAAAWDALCEDREGYVRELDERDEECDRLEAERDALRAVITYEFDLHATTGRCDICMEQAPCEARVRLAAAVEGNQL